MFDRLERLIGSLALEKLKSSHVVVLGLGGVGGYTFEVLVRSGIKFITVIDFDIFENSNFNRQIYATIDTLNKKNYYYDLPQNQIAQVEYHLYHY